MNAPPPRELLLFANPLSGRGRSGEAAARARVVAVARGATATIVTDRGELRERLAAASAERCELWVFGGDGTLGVAVAAFPPGARPLLAIVPTGTGNVVARSLRIPLRLRPALEVAWSAPERAFDLGHCGDRVFTFMASAGIDAEIAAEVAAIRRGPMRKSDWIKAALRVPRYSREEPLRVRADGEDLGKVRFAALFNCGLYAGSFRVCPSACFDDGWLQLLVLREPVRPRWLKVVAAAWRGQLDRLPDATLRAVRRVELQGVTALQLDGDPAPGGEVVASLDARPLRVRAPPAPKPPG